MSVTTVRRPVPARVRILTPHPPYDLQRTLVCGQAFRWRWDGTAAIGVFAGRRVRLTQPPDGVAVEGLEEDSELLRLRSYLGLDEPLEAIESELHRDPVLRRMLPHTSGIAIMRQDPWECVLSFIVSAFNNIPKIELSLERLTRRFGEAVGGAGWAFPTAAQLAQATPAALRRCALGYRTPYVLAVARAVDRGAFDLNAPAAASYEEARAMLLRLPGVGEKVADCVLLFAYGKGEAFPVDVWVKRAVEGWYFGGRKRTERQIREFARERFGPLAGYAQQHIFYYARAFDRRTLRESLNNVLPSGRVFTKAFSSPGSGTIRTQGVHHEAGHHSHRDPPHAPCASDSLRP